MGTGIDVLIISSTVYNEIPSEPTVIVVPIFDHDPIPGSVWHWVMGRGQRPAW